MSNPQRPSRGWFICGTDGVPVRAETPSAALVTAETYDKEFPEDAPHLVAAVTFEWRKPGEIDQP